MTTNRPSQHYCFVIHALAPYCYDFLQILGLPSGFSYRHRYDQRWVAPDVQSRPEALVNREVLTVFWDPDANVFHPIRWGTITSAQKVGRILYFEYRLGELAAYDNDPSARAAQLAGFNDTFRGFHPNGSEECVFGSTIGQHVGRVTFDDLTNWGNALDVIAKAGVFVGVEFLKLMDISEGEGLGQVHPIAGVYTLRPGRSYRLRVFQIIPNPPAAATQPHDVELNAFSDQLQILRHRQKAVGKYDVLTFMFKVGTLVVGEQAPLEIRAVVQAPSIPAAIQSIYVPISVAPVSGTERLLRTSGLLVSLALIFLPRIVELGPWVTSVGMISFVLSVAGFDGLKKVLVAHRSASPGRKG